MKQQSKYEEIERAKSEIVLSRKNSEKILLEIQKLGEDLVEKIKNSSGLETNREKARVLFNEEEKKLLHEISEITKFVFL